ncbi:MAG: HTH domain-containing protein [Planctomycetaceae bacterium]|nr:HTH domain-containing protein [Planctomycetaceae bacterium]
MNLKELAAIIIRDAQKPLSPVEIWEIAEPQGYKEKLGLTGRTIPTTIGAQLYVDIKDNPDSVFLKIKTKPTRFYLKDLLHNDDTSLIYNQPTTKSVHKNKSYSERDLHSLLSYYVYTYHSIYTKTIFHENSAKKSYAQWQHPDMVGVFYPMELWESEIYEVVNFTGNQPVKMFSYELKKELTFSNLRESYFQAVSNSSWANEGYLVASEIDRSDDFMSEIIRLSNSFGIGLISLITANPDDSEIIIQARQKDILDIEMMNKISQINPNFKEFLMRIKIDLNSKEIRKEKFDKIIESDELIKKF